MPQHPKLSAQEFHVFESYCNDHSSQGKDPKTCNHDDYYIPVLKCGENDDVGSWLAVNIKDGLLVREGVVVDEDALPTVRVVQDKAEILTSGRLAHPFCKTKEFGAIPILCGLPSFILHSSIEIDAWARRLSAEESSQYKDVLWGVNEIVKIREQPQSRPSSRATPEAEPAPPSKPPCSPNVKELYDNGERTKRTETVPEDSAMRFGHQSTDEFSRHGGGPRDRIPPRSPPRDHFPEGMSPRGTDQERYRGELRRDKEASQQRIREQSPPRYSSQGGFSERHPLYRDDGSRYHSEVSIDQHRRAALPPSRLPHNDSFERTSQQRRDEGDRYRSEGRSEPAPAWERSKERPPTNYVSHSGATERNLAQPPLPYGGEHYRAQDRAVQERSRERSPPRDALRCNVPDPGYSGNAREHYRPEIRAEQQVPCERSRERSPPRYAPRDSQPEPGYPGRSGRELDRPELRSEEETSWERSRERSPPRYAPNNNLPESGYPGRSGRETGRPDLRAGQETSWEGSREHSPPRYAPRSDLPETGYSGRSGRENGRAELRAEQETSWERSRERSPPRYAPRSNPPESERLRRNEREYQTQQEASWERSRERSPLRYASQNGVARAELPVRNELEHYRRDVRPEQETAWKGSRGPSPPRYTAQSTSGRGSPGRNAREHYRPEIRTEQEVPWERSRERSPPRYAPSKEVPAEDYRGNRSGNERPTERMDRTTVWPAYPPGFPPKEPSGGNTHFDNSGGFSRPEVINEQRPPWPQPRRPSPPPRASSTIPPSRSFASEASELEELFGLITGVTESRYLNEWIGFVWTRHCRDGRQGILHLGYNEAEAWAFTPGKWIQFAIPSNYAWKVFNTANQDRPRLELVPEDCTIVKPLFDTFVSRDSVEIELNVSVLVSHRTGDNYYVTELGAISDPLKQLVGGRDYKLRIALNRPGRYDSGREVVPWRITAAIPIGESWAPRHTRKEKIKRPPQPAPVQQPTQKQQVPPKSPTPSCTSKNAAKKDESSSEGSEESYKVVAKPLDEDQEKQRHKVTSVAMVEEYLEAKQKYRVWLLEYHREAEFCSANRVLQPGHFFQGRFSIGGQHKNRGHAYLQSFKTLLEGEYVTTEEPKGIRVYVDALHTNRKNGRCFEVYHEYLGYVRDTKNLLKLVDDSTYVRIVAQRFPYAEEDGARIWQIVELLQQ